MSKIYIFFFVSLLALMPWLVSAQESFDLSLELSPENPSAFQEVSAKLVAYSIDLTQTEVFWYLDGKLELAGIGKTSFKFRVGDIGTQKNLKVVALSGINALTKDATISVGEVDLLWQATSSYVPPFYRGKALPAPESNIRIVAIPNIKDSSGARLKPGDFSYKWTLNGNPDLEASGYGKNFFNFKKSFLKDENEISVSIKSLEGFTVEKRLTAAAYQPKILFYLDDPFISKRQNKALLEGEFINRKRFTVFVEPYFFDTKSPNSGALSYSWIINGQEFTNRPNMVDVSLEEGQFGTLNISLGIKNQETVFQSFKQLIRLNY